MSTKDLQQPWKNWYQPVADTNHAISNPFANAVCLNSGGQGAMPQKPREVDLSKPKIMSVFDKTAGK